MIRPRTQGFVCVLCLCHVCGVETCFVQEHRGSCVYCLCTVHVMLEHVLSKNVVRVSVVFASCMRCFLGCFSVPGHVSHMVHSAHVPHSGRLVTVTCT